MIHWRDCSVSLQTSGNSVYHIILALSSLHSICVLSYRLQKWFWEEGSNWKRLKKYIEPLAVVKISCLLTTDLHYINIIYRGNLFASWIVIAREPVVCYFTSNGLVYLWRWKFGIQRGKFSQALPCVSNMYHGIISYWKWCWRNIYTSNHCTYIH